MSRSDSGTSRVLTNEEDVEGFYIALGFEAASLSQMSLVEKLQLFSSARRIAGPGGAGLLHRLFFPGPRSWELLMSNSFLYWDFFLPQLILKDDLMVHSVEALPSFNPHGHYFPRNHASFSIPVDCMSNL